MVRTVGKSISSIELGTKYIEKASANLNKSLTEIYVEYPYDHWH